AFRCYPSDRPRALHSFPTRRSSDLMHDALTGLPNRAFLQRRLAAALDDVCDGRSPGAAIMILDLDGFKEVNDTLGHQQGDLLLRSEEHTSELQSQSNLVCRLLLEKK